ncbi:MAG: flagellar hook-basal body complex protein FliE [Planctomycetota bacterium]
MSDPLGLIGNSGGIRPTPPPTSGARAPAADAPDFKEVLLGNLKEVNELQADATRAIEDLQSGQRDDVEGVILATQKADMAFKMLQSVRNKVVQAYNELRDVRV